MWASPLLERLAAELRRHKQWVHAADSPYILLRSSTSRGHDGVRVSVHPQVAHTAREVHRNRRYRSILSGTESIRSVPLSFTCRTCNMQHEYAARLHTANEQHGKIVQTTQRAPSTATLPAALVHAGLNPDPPGTVLGAIERLTPLIGSACLDTICGTVIKLLEAKTSLHQLRLVPGCGHRRRKRIPIWVQLRRLLADFAQLHRVIERERATRADVMVLMNAPASWLRRQHPLVRRSSAPRF